MVRVYVAWLFLFSEPKQALLQFLLVKLWHVLYLYMYCRCEYNYILVAVYRLFGFYVKSKPLHFHIFINLMLFSSMFKIKNSRKSNLPFSFPSGTYNHLMQTIWLKIIRLPLLRKSHVNWVLIWTLRKIVYQDIKI